MARPRKALSAQAGHLTKETQEKRRYEESLVKGPTDELDRTPVKLLRDKVARAEYKRQLSNLKKMEMISNLDRNNLIMYANEWSKYVYFQNSEKAVDDPETLAMIDQAEKRCTDKLLQLGSKLGMSMDARLKAAQAKASTQNAEITEEFGDI